ncbi:MAG: type I methionyl aminopeptidase [Coxiellaceae bacterium]|jgi:methionyl aminopeptidase|nr:type I methionyl aminopeptidase [Coxiellaceae bacterium]
MKISIKSPEQIQHLKAASRLAAEVLEMIEQYVKVGISTIELNRICHDYIVDIQHAIPASLNYRGFPKSICTSVNHVVCHGIPNEGKLKSGDIINIDVTVIKNGFFGDTSKMFIIGKTSSLAKHLVKTAQECLYLGIQEVKPGAYLGNIGEIIQRHAEENKFSVVREYCGHGIGNAYHESPQILHYGKRNTGIVLLPGMVFTIEPMINAGTYHTRILNDNWTVVTEDGKLSAQWEHTILVTKTGYEILSKRKEEDLANI